jgi:hypothetical protein
LEGTLFRANRCFCTPKFFLYVPFNFNLSAESLIDKAIQIRYLGGVYTNQRPTEFLCLLLKLLQIQPEKEILIEYLQADEFKEVFTTLLDIDSYPEMVFQVLESARGNVRSNDVQSC